MTNHGDITQIHGGNVESKKQPHEINVLIACEESQRVCAAFRERGFNAYSCDLQECSGGHPEWHIRDDALETLRGGDIKTMDFVVHYIPKWDLVIAHPPCTYLSNAGACRLYPQKGQLDKDRYIKGLKGKQFFMTFWLYGWLQCGRICIENPVPSKIYELPEKSQVIQPFEFKEPFSKKTYLWNFGVPNLIPTGILDDYKPYVSCGTSTNKGNPDKAGYSRKGGAQKSRSKTFPGIAKAMAEQWGDYLMEVCE